MLSCQQRLHSDCVDVSIVRHVFRTFCWQIGSRQLVGERCERLRLSLRRFDRHKPQQPYTDRNGLSSKTDSRIRTNFEEESRRWNWKQFRHIFKENSRPLHWWNSDERSDGRYFRVSFSHRFQALNFKHSNLITIFCKHFLFLSILIIFIEYFFIRSILFEFKRFLKVDFCISDLLWTWPLTRSS